MMYPHTIIPLIWWEQLVFLPWWCRLIIKYHWSSSQESKPVLFLLSFGIFHQQISQSMYHNEACFHIVHCSFTSCICIFGFLGFLGSFLFPTFPLFLHTFLHFFHPNFLSSSVFHFFPSLDSLSSFLLIWLSLPSIISPFHFLSQCLFVSEFLTFLSFFFSYDICRIYLIYVYTLTLSTDYVQ